MLWGPSVMRNRNLELLFSSVCRGEGWDEESGATGPLTRRRGRQRHLPLPLHLMRALKIHTCWSTDFHLGLTGVSLVLDLS